MNPITLQTSPRFSSIIPITRVYNEAQSRMINPIDEEDRVVFGEAVFQFESLVRGDYPYGESHAPPLPSDRLQEIVAQGRAMRDLILGRLRLIDPDFANDPEHRVVTLGFAGEHYALTGDDAQATLDADHLMDSIDAMFNRTSPPSSARRCANWTTCIKGPIPMAP